MMNLEFVQKKIYKRNKIIKYNEKKFKTLEKERTDEMEVAEKKNEKRKEEEKSTISKRFINANF